MHYEADTHSHTLASGHAYNTIMEMAKAASDKGLKLLAITDHAPMIPGAPKPIYFSNYYVVDREISGVQIMMGVELNVLDYEGTLDLPEKILKRQDITIASFHIQCYQPGDIEQNTAAMLGAMSNPYVDIIGHPDDSAMPLDYERVVQKAAETGAIMEVNENSFRQKGLRQNCEENVLTYLAICKRKGVPVTMGSDAHYISRVGVHDYAESMLKKADFPEELVMNTSAEKLYTYLKERKARIAAQAA